MSTDRVDQDLSGDVKHSARDKVLERRRAIMASIREAAIDEFASKGLDGASTQSIASRAGLTKPQLHYYISSKENLYEEILVHILDEWRVLFIDASAGESPKDIISAYIRKKLEFSRTKPKASRLFTNEIANGASVLSKHWGTYVAATQQGMNLIQSWVDDGLIRPVDPLLFQMHMWAVTQHYADFDAQVRRMMEVGEDEEIDFDRIDREVTSLFLRSCGLE
jgi:TetR/AcrR family transcriptional regulator